MLIEAGADIEAVSAPDSGGVPSGTAPTHAAVFGLFVSATTAKAHLVHIYAKLGVSDRTAAVTTALEHGIIRLDQT